MPLFHNDESMYSDTRDQQLAEKDKTIQAMGKSCADYQNKIRLLENELADISNKVSYLMVKIVSENVPLFSSDRLRHIHVECREILDLVKNRVTTISFEKPPIAEMTVTQELEKLRAENTNLKRNILKLEGIASCKYLHQFTFHGNGICIVTGKQIGRAHV